MAPTIFFILLASLFIHASTHLQSNEEGFISVIISQKGLNFAKNLLVEQAISTLTPLELPQIQKSVNIPVVGNVHFTLSNTTIYRVDISKSVVQAGDTGIAIVASGATANLSMNWSYYYKSWLIEVSDEGGASVQVEGMEVGLTLGLENHEGTLKLSLLQCGCIVKDISITLDGGASWLYQGFVDTFEGQIRSAVENAIIKKMEEGISKLDSLLRTLPKEIAVDDVAALNVTFVNDPLLTDSTIELDISGLFTAADKVVAPKHFKNSQPLTYCSQSNMLGISLDEAVFNSLSAIYFNANRLQWIVDEVPEQALLNTAAWKHIIPKLYKKYPNNDMILNISLLSPLVRISYPDYIDASIYADMIIDVLDANETIPVACISLVISASGAFKVEGNNLGGYVTLGDFSLSLKWSDVGDFHMFLVQSVVRTFLKTIALPYVNLRLRQGFPLPILRGFTLENTDVRCTNSRLVICSDVVFTGSYDLKQLPTKVIKYAKISFLCSRDMKMYTKCLCWTVGRETNKRM